MRSIILVSAIFSLIPLSALAKSESPIKVADLKLELGNLKPCLEATIEKVNYTPSVSQAALHLKYILKKPITECMSQSPKGYHTITVFIEDSEKNELLSRSLSNSNDLPSKVEGIKRSVVYINQIPENLKAPITMTLKEEPFPY